MTENQEKILNDDRFLRLLRDCQNNIYAYILSRVQNRTEADDIMQDTITTMWRKLDDFAPGTNFSAWGIKIAKNLVLKHFNKYRNSRLQFNDKIIETIEAAVNNKISEMDNRKDALKGCLKKMKQGDVKVIQMRYQENLTIKKIAALTGRSSHNMYRKVAGIHQSLHSCIQRSLMQME